MVSRWSPRIVLPSIGRIAVLNATGTGSMTVLKAVALCLHFLSFFAPSVESSSFAMTK
jgi:hypothetical protein